jgi:hypothetical protein
MNEEFNVELTKESDYDIYVKVTDSGGISRNAMVTAYFNVEERAKKVAEKMISDWKEEKKKKTNRRVNSR